MKRLIIFSLLFTLLNSNGFARDFVVELVEEKYKEFQHWSKMEYSPHIFHSMHITLDGTQKLIVLTGKNHVYRKWLRQYIADNKYFIIQVPKNEEDLFQSSKAYEIDVSYIHPYKMSTIKEQEKSDTDISEEYKSAGKYPDKKQTDRKKLKRTITDEQAKKSQTEKERNAEKAKRQKEAEEKRSSEREKALKIKTEKDALEDEKLRAEAEKEWSKRKEELRAEADKEAALEEKRRKEADKRWLERERELKARLLKETLEERKRRKAADIRWLKRKRLLKDNRFYRL